VFAANQLLARHASSPNWPQDRAWEHPSRLGDACHPDQGTHLPQVGFSLFSLRVRC